MSPSSQAWCGASAPRSPTVTSSSSSSSRPPIGAGVVFDSVVVLNPDGTGMVVLILPNQVVTPLPAGSVTVSGNTITGVFDISLLPSNGTTAANYGYNLWPRSGFDPTDNRQISDFAPDASTVTATIPEPGAWALMITGFGLAGAMLRRSRRFATARA